MSQRKWGTGLIVSTIFAVLALVVGLLAGSESGDGATPNTDPPTIVAEEESNADEESTEEAEDESEEVASDEEATEEEDKATLTADELEELIALLTVSTVSEGADCPSTGQFGAIGLRVGALEDIPPRLESDFMSTPVQATEPEPARDEIQGAVCEDPLLGVSYLVFFATDVRDELLDKTGIDVLELNEWMKPFAVEPSEINSLAAEYIPLLDVDDPSEEQVVEALAKNWKWQKLASYANTLLDRFKPEGIKAHQSVVNYHLAVGGLVVGGLPEVERNPNQEDMPALVLSLTEKDQCVPLVVIGFNVGDKRPELFEPPVCEPPTEEPPGEEPPGEEPPTTTTPPPATTTPPPGTTVPPTTTTTVPPPPTTTTVPPRKCGDKNKWYDDNGNGVVDDGECRPPLRGGTTLPPPPVTAAPPSTVYQPPTPPSTAAPDTLPPGVTPTTWAPDPPVVTHVPPGGTNTTVPHTTVAPSPTTPSNGTVNTGTTPTPP